MKNNRSKLKMFLLLILANFFWGGTFSIVKLTVAKMDVYSFLFFRFLIGSLIIFVLYPKNILNIKKVDLIYGSIVGITMIFGYIFQTIGLKYTTASKSGFIMILSILIVPILSKIFLKTKIKKNTLIGFLLAIIGLIILTIKKDLHINKGDILTIVSSISFGFQIVAVSIALKKVKNIFAFTFIELLFVSLFSLIMSLYYNSFVFPSTNISFLGIFLTSVFATAFGFIIQTKAQSIISPVKASLTYATEPVFAAILGSIILGELFTIKEAAGALFIFLGMIISEMNLFYSSK